MGARDLRTQGFAVARLWETVVRNQGVVVLALLNLTFCLIRAFTKIDDEPRIQTS